MSEEREPTEAELIEEREREDAAVAHALKRLDFSPCGDDCPFLVQTPLQGMLWQQLTGEATPAPDASSFSVRVEVERLGVGGWLNVEPKDRWSPDQVSKAKLRARFGGGRLWRLSIRYKGDTLRFSVTRLDLTDDAEAYPPRPIPGDDPPPRAASSAPVTQAATPTHEALDPAAMLLSRLPEEHRGPVAFAFAMTEREGERQRAFYQASLDLVRSVTGGQTANPAGSAELVRRLERDVDDARRERDSLRAENARLTSENFQLRQRLALVEAYGAHVGGAPSPVWDMAQKLLGAAAPEFARGLASRLDPNGLMRLAETALQKLPAEQVAGALAAAGGGVPS